MNIAEAKNLSIGYHRKNDVNIIKGNINLKFESSSLIALVGSNGIGKSTLLKTLAGLKKPIAGDVILLGNDVQSLTPLKISKLRSVVLTDRIEMDGLRVSEIVTLGRQPHTNWAMHLSLEDKNIINESMSLVGVSEFSQRRFDTLSDGQKQRVMIARALSQDTPFILLDEPTTYLDMVHKVGLLKLLRKIAIEKNKCVLFSTHDIELALQMSDELVVMTDDGIYKSTPDDLVSLGVLHKLFPKDHLRFDELTLSFKIVD